MECRGRTEAALRGSFSAAAPLPSILASSSCKYNQQAPVLELEIGSAKRVRSREVPVQNALVASFVSVDEQAVSDMSRLKLFRRTALLVLAPTLIAQSNSPGKG